MKKSKRQILSLMAAAVMAAGLLSGCGGTEEAAETTAAAAETTAGRRRRSCCGRRDRGCGRGHGGLFRCRDHLRYDFRMGYGKSLRFFIRFHLPAAGSG